MTPALPQFCADLLVSNPLQAADHDIAEWFHSHLTWTFAAFLRALSEPGSGEWIGGILFLAFVLLAWKRRWSTLATVALTVPCGILLNEFVLKALVHRPRPFVDGPFADWSGYGFASSHTIAATLLYGQFLVLAMPAIKTMRQRTATVMTVIFLVVTVGFSRIALGAHYLTDVLAAVVFGILWLAFGMGVTRSIQRTFFARMLTVDGGVGGSVRPIRQRPPVF